MSSNTEDRQFAFGENSRDGCPCPLNAVGKNPEISPNIEVAETYDEIVGEMLGIGWGKAPEDVAKEAWLEVIEHYEEVGVEEHPVYREVARETAAELGWL